MIQMRITPSSFLRLAGNKDQLDKLRLFPEPLMGSPAQLALIEDIRGRRTGT